MAAAPGVYGGAGACDGLSGEDAGHPLLRPALWGVPQRHLLPGGGVGGDWRGHQPVQPGQPHRHGQHIPVLRRNAADLLHHRRGDKLHLRLELYQGLGGVCVPLPSHGFPGAADFAPRRPGAGPQAGGVRRVCGAEPAAGQLSPHLRHPLPGGAGVLAVWEEVGKGAKRRKKSGLHFWNSLFCCAFGKLTSPCRPLRQRSRPGASPGPRPSRSGCKRQS